MVEQQQISVNSEFKIFPATEEHFKTIKELNDAVVELTSPMDIERIKQLDKLSSYHKVVCQDDGTVVAFLLCFSPKSEYDSENYQWYNQRYTEFVYIDRIVVGQNAGRKGIGQALYNDLFAWAGAKSVPMVACEINSKPPNVPSANFHAKMGFEEVGTMAQSAEKEVSM